MFGAKREERSYRTLWSDSISPDPSAAHVQEGGTRAVMWLVAKQWHKPVQQEALVVVVVVLVALVVVLAEVEVVVFWAVMAVQAKMLIQIVKPQKLWRR